MNNEVLILLKNGKSFKLADFIDISFFRNRKLEKIDNLIVLASLSNETLKITCKSEYIIINKSEISCMKFSSSIFLDN